AEAAEIVHGANDLSSSVPERSHGGCSCKLTSVQIESGSAGHTEDLDCLTKSLASIHPSIPHLSNPHLSLIHPSLICSSLIHLSSIHLSLEGLCLRSRRAASPQSTRGSRSTLTGPLVHSGACTPGLFCISYTFWFPQGEGSASSQSTLVMARHSKLQKQVLALYRQFLQAGRDKPGFVPRIREEFRVNARIKKTDVMHIEYLYRRGQRQLEQLRDSNTKQLGSFSNPANQS
uniref:Complex 1 LYR protein domain-containing protein n=1 Tax=Takifugu rubripes TaxID=31033 RepID=A0A674NHV6_TAKRU